MMELSSHLCLPNTININFSLSASLCQMIQSKGIMIDCVRYSVVSVHF